MRSRSGQCREIRKESYSTSKTSGGSAILRQGLRSRRVEQLPHLAPRIGLKVLERRSIRVGHALEDRLLGRRSATDALPPNRDPPACPTFEKARAAQAARC